MELLSAQQMRAAERDAIDTGNVTGLDLMERAGQGVVDAVRATWPDEGRLPSAAILCGPGNNGGDGFVIARLLRGLGWRVSVFLYGEKTALPTDAATNAQRWSGHGEIKPWDDGQISQMIVGQQVGLVVDALFGTGMSRDMPADTAQTAQALQQSQSGPHVVAVDLPSGVNSDTGADHGAFAADLTVTFHRAKLGHYLGVGPEHCGAVQIVDIGLSNAPISGAVELITQPHAAQPKGRGQHKYSHGHALVLTGGAGRTGAARLSARAALRIGAGLVTLGVPGAAQFEVAAQVTALMLTRIDTAEALTSCLSDARLNALCIGPGLGVDRAAELVPAALFAQRPTVLDADALTAFQDVPDTLFAMLRTDCVLTPHAGEFARLFPDLAARAGRAEWSKPDAVRAAAARAGCVVLLKGADTVVAEPDGRVSLHAAAYERCVPWLATAGAGDVLAGFITGLLARGVPAMDAAESAAWFHVECAHRFGPGLIAEDLPDVLPAVLGDLPAGSV